MLKGLGWLSFSVPAHLWLSGWVRRGAVLEQVLCSVLTSPWAAPSFGSPQLILTWARLLFFRPLTPFSFPLCSALLVFYLGGLRVFSPAPVLTCLGGVKGGLAYSLLHGQSRRWGPLGFFVRWWAVSAAALFFSPVDTNRGPHDYWLAGAAASFAVLF
jgi:hypothetical protein